MDGNVAGEAGIVQLVHREIPAVDPRAYLRFR